MSCTAACRRPTDGDALSRAQAAEARPFSTERGRLRIAGTHFEDEDGRPWRWRGATAFLLPARFFAGENIEPDLEWFVRRGRNVVRTFWTASFDAARPLHWEQPGTRPDFASKADAFFDRCASHGLRVEATVLTHAFDRAAQHAFLQQMYDLAARHWNVFIEVANEPEANGLDPVSVLQGIDRHGVLSALGLDPARAGAGKWAAVPVLDYGTTHDLDRDLEHSSWNSIQAREMQDVLHVPFVYDEPIGVIDPGHAGYERTGSDRAGAAIFGHIGGGGARTTNCDVIRSAAAIADLLTAGYTLHLQDGLEGRTPSAAETVEDGCAASLVDIEQFIPPEAQLGRPVSPGQPDFGLAWRSGPHLESMVDRAFGSVIGNRQWLVVALPSATWQGPQPAPGWRVDARGPIGSIVRLIREPN